MTKSLLSLFVCGCLLSPAPLLAQEDPAEEPSPRDAQQEEESPEEQLDRLLKTRKVTLNFQETPLLDVVAFLQDITEQNIVLHPKVPADDITVSLRLKEISLLNALKLVLASDETLDFAIWSGAVVVKTKATTLPARPALGEGEVAERLTSQNLSLNFDMTPFPEVLDFFRDITGLNVVVAAEAAERVEEAEVSLRVRDLQLARALRLLTELQGLTYVIENEAVVIKLAE